MISLTIESPVVAIATALSGHFAGWSGKLSSCFSNEYALKLQTQHDPCGTLACLSSSHSHKCLISICLSNSQSLNCCSFSCFCQCVNVVFIHCWVNRYLLGYAEAGAYNYPESEPSREGTWLAWPYRFAVRRLCLEL